MARVLVTGGAGFIGHHLVGLLQARGDRVRVLDLMAPVTNIEGVDYVRGSVGDAATVDAALDGIDMVYHLAGIAHLWCQDKAEFERINLHGTQTMLKAAKRKGIVRFVHCSTELILLPKQRNGAFVDETVRPTLDDMAGPYTRSKFLGERAALDASCNGLDVVIVNPTVPIGVGDRNMTPPAAMIALFLSGGLPFYLDCVLNFVDVRGLAVGIAEAAMKGRSGERYILGGENVTIRELLERLEEKSGTRMPKRSIPVWVALLTGLACGWFADTVTHRPPVATREGVMLALRSAPFDCSKARRELGYQPAPIDRALTETIAAFKRKG